MKCTVGGPPHLLWENQPWTLALALGLRLSPLVSEPGWFWLLMVAKFYLFPEHL